MKVAILLLLASVFAVGCTGHAEAAGPTFRELGPVILTVGVSPDGTAHGFKLGEYGAVDGVLPSAFFTSSGDRQISELYEHVADGRPVWRIGVTGARASSWAADLDVIVTTTHADLVDSRRFVVEDFALDRGAALELRPPLPPGQRDWRSRQGEEVRMVFSVYVPPPTIPSPPPIQEADVLDGTFTAWLQETTPGGAVTAQLLITTLVFVMFMARAPQTPWGVMMASVVLILTPWAPVMFGIGDTIAASIVFVNVLSGAFVYKVFAARTE